MPKDIVIENKIAKIRVHFKRVKSDYLICDIKELLNKYEQEEFVQGDDVLIALKKKFKDSGTIGFNVRVYRCRLDMTQKELAAKAQIAQGDISKIENNKLSPGVVMAKKLGTALRCDYHKFL